MTVILCGSGPGSGRVERWEDGFRSELMLANVTRAQMAVFLAKALGLHWPY
jgi:hypothetical protein